MTIDKSLKLAVERTRDDLGPTGSNYPDVRRLLEFAEAAIADEKEAQAKQEPVGEWVDPDGFGPRLKWFSGYAVTVGDKLYLAPQHQPEKHLEMVAPADTDCLLGRLRTDVLWHKRRGNDTIARDCEEAANEIERLRMQPAPADVPLPEPYDHIHEWDTPLYVESDLDSAPKNGRPPSRSIPVFTTKQFLLGRDAYAAARVAAERERIKSAVTRLTLLAENCEGDGPEVDTARKSLAFKILAAIAGYEAPPQVGAQYGLFEAGKKGTT